MPYANEETNQISCNNCKYAMLRDYGYSNYTVEGTTFSCAYKLHPDEAFDRFYGENPKMAFAQQCPKYEKGEPVYFDVDGEREHTEAELEIIKIKDAVSMIAGKD